MPSLLPGKDFTASQSHDLVLRHPTPDEGVKIGVETAEPWGDSLPPAVYLKECEYLTTIPLAKDENMTTWILVNKNDPPDQRSVFCSCETIRKHSLTSDSQGNVTENVVHGIASVFCPPELRRQGYAARLMKELTKVLPKWRMLPGSQCIGTILYSDIGKAYYTKLGWYPNATNRHVELRAQSSDPPTKPISVDELGALCKRDEAIVRRIMAVPSKDIRERVTIIPDLDHILWHIGKEEFTTTYLFSKTPRAKGAIIGQPGSQVWAIWAHRYYDRLDAADPENVLFILRLVVERDRTATRLPSDADKVEVVDYEQQQGYLKAVLQAAQAEAAAWKLGYVRLWDPTPLVQKMIAESGLKHDVVDREEDNIASAMWYSNSQKLGEAPLWVNNEYYTWL